jgi:uncharacterized protein YndB with AHSA1/START domain
MNQTKPFARVIRGFDAAAERVFDAWLDPKSIGRWMFGPDVRDEQIVNLAIDPHEGEAFAFVVRRSIGEFSHVGTYKEIVRPRRLSFTWAVIHEGKSDGESLVMVDIRSVENGSELTLTHELAPGWENFTAQAEAAWTKMLDALARYLGSPGG